MRLRSLLAVLALAAVAACTDFATPNQLERPTIIAVVAEPPVVMPGAQAEITVVIADQTGVLTGLPTRWTLGEAYPGIAPMGTLTSDADRATYHAPSPVPTRPDNVPPIDSIAVTIDTADGPRNALKAMPVLPAGTANPTIAALTVGPTDALTGPVTVTRGQTLALTVTTDPPASDMTTYAWYTPVGDIKYYQSSPCEMIVPDDAAPGPLLIVVRDGMGGVVWRQVDVQVQ